MDKHSQNHTHRAAKSAPRFTAWRATATLALLATPLTFLPSVASGQLRVDATLYASSGSCSNCDLSGKRMNGMTLKNANFAGSLFNDSNLSGGKLDGSDLTGAHFRKARLYGVRGERVIMRGAVFEDATLTGAVLTHSSLIQANLHRAELERGQFHDNDFQSADLTGAKLTDSNLARSNFDRARLDNADLSGTVLDGGQFTHVKFGLANLADASMDGTNLSNADLSLVAGLTQTQLDGACGNMHTRLPAGLALGYCDGVNLDPPVVAPKAASQEARTMAAALDRAISDIEILLVSARDTQTRARLQRIHRDLMQSRETLSQ